MPSASSTGDLTLTVRPATEASFAPYGAVLGVGERVELAQGGPLLATLDVQRPGPRRFTHLQRYPEARRFFLPVGDASLLLLVMAAGDPPAGSPAAFRTVPGHGLLIEAGVWHAGPVPLKEGPVLELLETPHRADRLDRRPLRDLAGAEAVRIRLPDAPGAPPPDLDLEAPGALFVVEPLDAALRVGLLLVDELEVGKEADKLAFAWAETARAVRALGDGTRDRSGLLGVHAARGFWRDLGLDPARRLPPYEERIQAALDGDAPPSANGLDLALDLCALKRQIEVRAYDADEIVGPLQLRRGKQGERYADAGGRRRALRGLPVLCDGAGPFGTPFHAARRVRTTNATRQALIALFVPARTEEGEILAHLEAVGRAVHGSCGGLERGHLVSRPPPGEPAGEE